MDSEKEIDILSCGKPGEASSKTSELLFRQNEKSKSSVVPIVWLELINMKSCSWATVSLRRWWILKKELQKLDEWKSSNATQVCWGVWLGVAMGASIGNSASNQMGCGRSSVMCSNRACTSTREGLTFWKFKKKCVAKHQNVMTQSLRRWSGSIYGCYIAIRKTLGFDVANIRGVRWTIEYRRKTIYFFARGISALWFSCTWAKKLR